MRREGRTLALGLLVAAVLLEPGAAPAHEAKLGIGGRKFSINTTKGPGKRRVRFVTRGQSVLTLQHDPSQVTTWLLVRGYGPDGGTSGRIVLDPTKWKRLGKTGKVKGYKYADRDGERGGITKVVLKAGKLTIVAGGERWPWEPAGPQESVWIHVGIDEETFCANFGGTVKRNEAGRFKARNASQPDACPVAVCGNAVTELGEACDDGNLDERDGCTTACEVGECVGTEYPSTFAAIQDLIFDTQGCTSVLCHGATPGQGNLSLLPAVAYDELFEVASSGSTYDRVDPANPRGSSLYLKLLKAYDPATPIPGASMPNGLAPVPEPLLEGLRQWIVNAAPETGTVEGTQSLFGGCFPEPEPISIEPLEPPDPSLGVQIGMPPVPIGPETEIEVCLATYYDVSDVVPEQFKDPSGEFFYVREDRTRQDPHSHHLVILDSGFDDADVYDPSFGTWRCSGGPSDGATCDPLDIGACGEGGFCHSEVRSNVACIGYGPPGGANAAGIGDSLGGAGNGQTSITLAPGLYRKVPLKAVVYWNVHAFNVTAFDHQLKAYLNLYFAGDPQIEVAQFLDVRHLYVAAGQPPYTRATYCRDYAFPQGSRVIYLSSHTHERGEAFWVNDPDGTRIYESYTYEDPVVQGYDPPLAFDDADPARRTIEYCATYGNGLDADGTPNPETVRTLSNTPPNALPCTPTHCTDGRVGAPCDGADDHATCDSIPGAGDGRCDACPITAGITTQDEMFVLTGWRYEVTP